MAPDKGSGSKTAGNISQLFASIQGEGPWCGVRQVFIRMWGCNLNCSCCDTPGHGDVPGTFTLWPVHGSPVNHPNGVSPGHLARLILPLLSVPCHSISLTGGEPLLQADFLGEFIQALPGDAPGIYLETNGTLASQLEKILDGVKYIAADIKLPWVLGGGNLWREHHDFLWKARRGDARLFVKAVVSGETAHEEIRTGAKLIAGVDLKIPLIIQPMTNSDGSVSTDGEKLMELQGVALEVLEDVRIIPQTHRFIKNLR